MSSVPPHIPRGRWIRPEVYVLIGAVCTGAGLAFYIASRHLVSNPDVLLSKRKRQMGMADEHDLAAIERERRFQESGLFRAMSKISPRRPDAIPYPGRHADVDTAEGGRAQDVYPGGK